MKTTLCLISVLVAGFTASLAVAGNGGGDHKTSICHKTHSKKNPFVYITVDDSAVTAHMEQHGDTFARDGKCPSSAAGWPTDDDGNGSDGGDEGGAL